MGSGRAAARSMCTWPLAAACVILTALDIWWILGSTYVPSIPGRISIISHTLGMSSVDVTMCGTPRGHCNINRTWAVATSSSCPALYQLSDTTEIECKGMKPTQSGSSQMCGGIPMVKGHCLWPTDGQFVPGLSPVVEHTRRLWGSPSWASVGATVGSWASHEMQRALCRSRTALMNGSWSAGGNPEDDYWWADYMLHVCVILLCGCLWGRVLVLSLAALLTPSIATGCLHRVAISHPSRSALCIKLGFLTAQLVLASVRAACF